MKGNPEVLQVLNDVLRMELTGINQYAMHAKMLQNWGYQKLGQAVWRESIDEMKHAETLMDRLLFLDGSPKLDELEKLRIGGTVTQQLENDLELETHAIERLRAGIALCDKVGDHVTRDVLSTILADEERHVDFIENHLHQIKELGYEIWLSGQVEAGE